MTVLADAENGAVDQLQSRTTKLALLLSGFGSARASAPTPKPGDAAEGRPLVRVDRYLRELEGRGDEADASELARAVKDLDPAQIERVVEARAIQRARYLAVLMEVTRGGRLRRALDEVGLRDLRRHREAFEELDRALAALKSGIAEGTIAVEGLVD